MISRRSDYDLTPLQLGMQCDTAVEASQRNLGYCELEEYDFQQPNTVYFCYFKTDGVWVANIAKYSSCKSVRGQELKEKIENTALKEKRVNLDDLFELAKILDKEYRLHNEISCLSAIVSLASRYPRRDFGPKLNLAKNKLKLLTDAVAQDEYDGLMIRFRQRLARGNYGSALAVLILARQVWDKNESVRCELSKQDIRAMKKLQKNVSDLTQSAISDWIKGKSNEDFNLNDISL